MDNATYDALNLTSTTTDETYSRLRTTQIKTEPSYELQQRANVGQSAINGAKQNSSKDSQNNTKYIVVLIIMIVILVLSTFASIAVSITTYSRLTSEQSKGLSQLDNTNVDMMSMQTRVATTQSYCNISQNDIELVLTQLATIQSNVSQMFMQHDAKLNSLISVQIQYSSLQTQTHCGPGLWHRVAFLNMSDPTHGCPFAWREYNMNGVRACGRPVNSSGSCPVVSYFIGHQYNRMCGRIIGYQFGTTDAFKVGHANNDIDLDGIKITYGAQRNHIWSYVAGLTQNLSSIHESNCPCSDRRGRAPPLSIGGNYYCESGNPDRDYMHNHLYYSDPLWDGQQCEGTCCTGTNSPPWFSVQLPAPITDMIEVSICCDQNTSDEDIPVELVEIYVQ